MLDGGTQTGARESQEPPREGTQPISDSLARRIQEELEHLSQPLFLLQVVAVFLGVGAVFTWGFWEDYGWLSIFPGFAVSVTLIVIGGTLAISARRTRVEGVQIARRAEELQENLDENFVTNLIKLNFKYIDKYYLQTQIQAERSFTLAAIVSVISLGVVIFGIFRSYYGTDGKLPGYIATFAGVLGQFIGAVFFYLYNQTIMKMGEYHQKLVLTQNINLAIKLVAELDGDSRKSAQLGVIESLTKDINRYLTGRPPKDTPASES